MRRVRLRLILSIRLSCALARENASWSLRARRAGDRRTQPGARCRGWTLSSSVRRGQYRMAPGADRRYCWRGKWGGLFWATSLEKNIGGRDRALPSQVLRYITLQTRSLALPTTARLLRPEHHCFHKID